MSILNIEETILFVAKTLFTTKLYVDVSIMDIITRANIARGSFYKYFATKDDCFVKSVAPVLQSTSDKLLAFKYQVSGRLQDLMEKHVEILKENIIALRNASAFMYATENKMLRHMLFNAFKSSRSAQMDVYSDCLKKQLPQAPEEEIACKTKILYLYITAVETEIRFDVTQSISTPGEASVSPKEYLEMLGFS
jgi:AcrR family transcriptional regulator